jgi:hypothetical protein
MAGGSRGGGNYSLSPLWVSSQTEPGSTFDGPKIKQSNFLVVSLFRFHPYSLVVMRRIGQSAPFLIVYPSQKYLVLIGFVQAMWEI